jgi:excisionase family DNA binding protein
MRRDRNGAGRDEDEEAVAKSVETVRTLLVTIPEAAAVLSVGRTTVYELIGNGQLTPVHIGRSVRLTVGQLEEFVDRLSDERSRSDE